MHQKKKLKRLQHTLMIAFLMLSITPLTLLALFFLQSHSSDLEKQSMSHISFLRDIKKQTLINYFDERALEVCAFAKSELANASGGRFYGLIAAFQQLGKTPEESRQQLRLNDFKSNSDQTNPNHAYFAASERYRLLHKRYDPLFKAHLKNSDFSDILLVDVNGNVVYSAQKNPWLGRNLLSAKWQNDGPAQAFKRIQNQVRNQIKNENDAPQATGFTFVDFQLNSRNQMLAWFAAPIMQQDYLHSYVLFALPNVAFATHLNHSPTENKTITTLLLGKDRFARNAIETQILPEDSAIAASAFAGQSSVGRFLNSNNEPVLSAYTPLHILGYDWALMLELPENLAFARIHHLENLFLLTMFIAIICVVMASHWLSNFIIAPLLKLTWIAEQVADGDLAQTICNTDRKDEIGRLAQSFARMQSSIREKIALISDQNKELEQNLQLIHQKNIELQQADRMKDNFLATTSHELRTPLHGMIGIAESLLAGGEGMCITQQKQQLPLLISSGQRLSALIDDLLDYHKIKYGNVEIHTQAIDSASAVRLVIELSSHLIGTKPIRIINQMPVDLPLIRADAQRLEQILYNLIGNAIKYTEEGKIIISSTMLEQQLRIQIVDTGQGIPAEQLHSIFEPLSQAPGKHVQSHQGSGLGLSISRQLIEIMGGQLYVSSQMMVGTTFSFTLPFATEEDKANTRLANQIHFHAPQIENYQLKQEMYPVNPNAPLILVVDDEPVNLQVLQNFLQIEGYRVKTFENGRQAIEYINQDKPKLILLDVMMPELSGYEVCSHLREQYSRIDLPIILLSALGQVQDKIKGFDAGANDYLTKPFNKDELRARIRAYVQASLTEQIKNKNRLLEKEILERDLIEIGLREVQAHLFDILHRTNDAILCIDKDGAITYANEKCDQVFNRRPNQLTRHHLKDFLISPQTYSNINANTQLSLQIDNQKITYHTQMIQLPPNSGLGYLIIFHNNQKTAAERVALLEQAVESLSEFALNGDSTQLQQLRELGGEFTRLADKFNGNRQDKNHQTREMLVKVMTLTLNYWCENTGKSKFDLAEESGLWRVYLDRSTLQARTLDKYLHVETVPKSPRWRTVFSTIDYVLERCQLENPDRSSILHLKERLHILMHK